MAKTRRTHGTDSHERVIVKVHHLKADQCVIYGEHHAGMRGFFLLIVEPLAPMCWMNLNCVACRYIDPKTIAIATWEGERVQAVLVRYRQDQIAIFWDRFKRDNKMPHTPLMASCDEFALI
jgi:hypothetical protein